MYSICCRGVSACGPLAVSPLRVDATRKAAVRLTTPLGTSRLLRKSCQKLADFGARCFLNLLLGDSLTVIES